MEIKREKRLSKVLKRASGITKELIKEVAESEGVSLRDAELIIAITYRFIADTIRKGKLETIGVIKLGRFVVKPYNLKRYEKDRIENKGKRLQGDS